MGDACRGPSEALRRSERVPTPEPRASRLPLTSTYEHIPGAETKIAFDKFHVAQHLGNRWTKVRRQEHRALSAESDKQLNKMKYLWLSNLDG